jgi:transcriptional regulator of acetoin/glycerol metabolism
MKRIDIDRALLLTTIINADGFIERAARILGVGRLSVMRRLREQRLDTRARQLRHATGWKCGRPR